MVIRPLIQMTSDVAPYGMILNPSHSSRILKALPSAATKAGKRRLETVGGDAGPGVAWRSALPGRRGKVVRGDGPLRQGLANSLGPAAASPLPRTPVCGLPSLFASLGRNWLGDLFASFRRTVTARKALLLAVQWWR
jgi:hypothetical protein